MADLVSSLENRPIISSASSSGADFADHDDYLEDACSICLEPFNSEDPPTVTNCKHEYHLHCILEWSQRSKECPICWQLLVLKDPASQELLAAVENERNLRSRRNANHTYEPYEVNRDNFYADDSDFDERIMRHFSTAARRARYVHRRGRQRSAAIGPSQVLPSAPTGVHLPDVQHMHSSPEEQSSSHELSLGETPALTILHSQNPSSVVPDDVNMELHSVVYRDSGIKSSQQPFESPQRPSSSEFLAFSESFKSKFSAASARYKESISKSTQGFKEKVLAHNISVKELGRGVQREMNAGIAGVARMIERLDLTSKKTGVSVPLSSCSRGTSNFSYKGKDMQESEITQYTNEKAGEAAHDKSSAAHDKSSAASPLIQCTIPGQLEVHLVQGGN